MVKAADLFSDIPNRDRIFLVEGESDQILVAQLGLSAVTVSMPIIPKPAAKCLGCHAMVPEDEQVDYLTRSGIICRDCHELFIEVGSSQPAVARPTCRQCGNPIDDAVRWVRSATHTIAWPYHDHCLPAAAMPF